MNNYSFGERLVWSKGETGATDADTIKALLPGCVSVAPAEKALDIAGVDFVATLRRGAVVYIDVKRRAHGVSRHWKEGPELTLELWSVCKSPTHNGTVGWTLDERKITDYVLYLFDKADCNFAYILPFQLLRIAFRKMAREWIGRYRVGRCSTDGRYETESVFVPARAVISAVSAEMSCAKQ